MGFQTNGKKWGHKLNNWKRLRRVLQQMLQSVQSFDGQTKKGTSFNSLINQQLKGRENIKRS
jgi:hypothetical protein